MLAPIRVTGLGGAYVASAEGVEGSVVNAASPAVRDAYSISWLDYDIALGASFLGGLAKTDFDNRGETDFSHARVGNFISLNVGAQVQLGHFGTCVTSDLQQFSVSSSASVAKLSLQIGRWRALAAYGLLNGQLVIGGGFRAITMAMFQGQGFDPRNGSFVPGGRTVFTMSGIGPEVGALLMPNGAPWRIGATLRAPVSGAPTSDDAKDIPLFLPSAVVLPWEVEVGVAYQLGPRPLNPTWQHPHDQEAKVRTRIDGDRARRAIESQATLDRLPAGRRPTARAELLRQEAALRELEDARLDAEIQRLHAIRKARYDNWPRERILLLASLLMTGASEDAISVAGFLDQRKELVGRSVSFTPRLGIEGEPINNRLRARVGTYVEPTRYADSFARQHFTFGADVKLFPFDLWGVLKPATWLLSAYLDIAPRYTNGGLGIGVWH